MTKNTYLNIAIYICNFFRNLFLLFFIVVTVVLVHSKISPETYDLVAVEVIQSGGYGLHFYDSIETMDISNNMNTGRMIFPINQLTTVSFFLLYFQQVAILLMSILAITSFEYVITSVKNMETFNNQNAKTLKKIGIYLLVISILTVISSVSIEGSLFGRSNFTTYKIPFTPLLLTLAAFIMSEIFKEGHKISKENELTI